jgi:hypothetical protein
MQPEPSIAGRDASWERIRNTVRVLQSAWVATFLVSIYNGALSAYQMASLLRRDAGGLPDFVQLAVLFSLGQILVYGALTVVLYGLFGLTTAPVASRAQPPAWTALALFLLGAVIDLATTFALPRLVTSAADYGSAIRAISMLGFLAHTAGLVFVVEALRRLEATAGGQRISDLRWVFFGVLVLRYLIAWGTGLAPRLDFGQPYFIWAAWGVRLVALGAVYALLLQMLNIVHEAARRR